MGLFGDIDVQNAQEVSFLLPADTYHAIVSNCEVKKTKDERKTGLNITYSVIQEGKFKGRTISEWQRVPTADDLDILDPEKREQAIGYLKRRMLSLGVPEDKINSTEASELIGTEVYVGVKIRTNNQTKEEQNQIASVKVASEVDTHSSNTGSFGGTFQ